VGHNNSSSFIAASDLTSEEPSFKCRDRITYSISHLLASSVFTVFLSCNKSSSALFGFWRCVAPPLEMDESRRPSLSFSPKGVPRVIMAEADTGANTDRQDISPQDKVPNFDTRCHLKVSGTSVFCGSRREDMQDMYPRPTIEGGQKKTNEDDLFSFAHLQQTPGDSEDLQKISSEISMASSDASHTNADKWAIGSASGSMQETNKKTQFPALSSLSLLCRSVSNLKKRPLSRTAAVITEGEPTQQRPCTLETKKITPFKTTELSARPRSDLQDASLLQSTTAKNVDKASLSATSTPKLERRTPSVKGAPLVRTHKASQGYTPIMPRPSLTMMLAYHNRAHQDYASFSQDQCGKQSLAQMQQQPPLVSIAHTSHSLCQSVTATLAGAKLTSSSAAHKPCTAPGSPVALQLPKFSSNQDSSESRVSDLIPIAPKPSVPAPAIASEGTGCRQQTMNAADALLFAASLLQGELPSPTQAKCMLTDVPMEQKQSYLASDIALSRPKSSIKGMPLELDVLCGRGGLINKHIGNIIYRRVVEHNKPYYQSVQKRHRILVSQSIVHTILKRGGRFLYEEGKTTTTNADGTTSSTNTVWKTVDTARAIQKTSQALREPLAVASRKNKKPPRIVTTEHSKKGTQMQPPHVR